jgi:thioredoxin reductase (NADPH)
MFIRGYTADLTMLTLGKVPQFTDTERKLLNEASIQLEEHAIVAVEMSGQRITELQTADGRRLGFDALYSALGTTVRSELATQAGAQCDDKGDLIVNKAMQTSVPGLYAAGDVVRGLSQICVATGHAAIAATAIHHHLS